jgi:hypothetical protein
MLSAIFVDRPRLAIVIAIVTTIAGMLALYTIPLAQGGPRKAAAGSTAARDCGSPGAPSHASEHEVAGAATGCGGVTEAPARIRATEKTNLLFKAASPRRATPARRPGWRDAVLQGTTA